MMPQDVLPPIGPQPEPSPSSSNLPVSRVADPDNSESPVKVVGAEDPKKEGWRSIISTIIILVAAPLVALLLINYVFQSYEVDGPSMEATLQNHDRLIVDKIPRTIARFTGNAYIPKRGDIIIFVKRELGSNYNLGDKQLIKRVIGLPGERVVIKDGKITVYNSASPDGLNPDNNPDLAAVIRDSSTDLDITIPAGKVFVCGDNRENSLDSRIFGPVDAKDIVGKLSFRIYPIAKAKSY